MQHNHETRIVDFTVFSKLNNPAIIIPGLVSGFIIWIAFFLNYAGIIPVWTQAHRAVFIELFLAPLLLVIAGAVSEIIRSREERQGWTPWIPYSAGFLGAGTAGFLVFTDTAVKQYLPLLEPGIAPRLAYVAGHVLMCIPIIIGISAFFALFSVVGGICMHGIRERVRD